MSTVRSLSDGVPYSVSRAIVGEYGDWLRQFPWQLFCTLTFVWSVSESQADNLFREFINNLEKQVRSPITYVRGIECSGGFLHYHVLMTSAAQLLPAIIEKEWRRFGGNRRDYKSAQARAYDPELNGVEYSLKFINSTGDWDFCNLDLFSPEIPANTHRQRRRQRRQAQRQQQMVSTNPDVRPSPDELRRPLRRTLKGGE